jgi:hypothetical protein
MWHRRLIVPRSALVDLAALKLKIDAVPAMREALFQPDWATAASDTLVLYIQMADHFEAGAGKDELGPASSQGRRHVPAHAGRVHPRAGIGDDFGRRLARQRDRHRLGR